LEPSYSIEVFDSIVLSAFEEKRVGRSGQSFTALMLLSFELGALAAAYQTLAIPPRKSRPQFFQRVGFVALK